MAAHNRRAPYQRPAWAGLAAAHYTWPGYKAIRTLFSEIWSALQLIDFTNLPATYLSQWFWATVGLLHKTRKSYCTKRDIEASRGVCTLSICIWAVPSGHDSIILKKVGNKKRVMVAMTQNPYPDLNTIRKSSRIYVVALRVIGIYEGAPVRFPHFPCITCARD